jgi:bacteriocin biosynthesis cyclodehydratase domain-containing protein
MSHLAIPAMPRLRPWFKIAKGDEGQLIMHYADVAVVMRGKAIDTLFPVLMPLLDGTRTIEQIVEQLGPAIEPVTRGVLQQFTDSGVLLSGPDLSGTAHAGAAATVNFLAATLPGDDSLPCDLAKLQRLRVTIAGSSSLSAHVAGLLQASGVGTVHGVSLAQALADPPESDLAIVTPDGRELPELPAWNLCALDARRRWMQVLPFDGRFAAIGPVYVPGETCCYECFLLRRESNVGYPDEFRALQDVASTDLTAPALDAAVAGIATVFALRWLLREDAALPGRFFAFEAGAEFGFAPHHVFRVPRCPACSLVTRIASPSPWFDAVV